MTVSCALTLIPEGFKLHVESVVCILSEWTGRGHWQHCVFGKGGPAPA